jgi:Dynamin family
VCVGQFKRGKSTLLNALIGMDVLPAGVIPVTSVVTVLRHGEQLGARVRFQDHQWMSADVSALADYVTEERNPDNRKGVSGVEVFVPSDLLAHGMSLVDTPGLGSVTEAGAAATHAFVPHIDAALVVLGADPPISGDELALIDRIADKTPRLIYVLNKADRVSEPDRREALVSPSACCTKSSVAGSTRSSISALSERSRAVIVDTIGTGSWLRSRAISDGGWQMSPRRRSER